MSCYAQQFPSRIVYDARAHWNVDKVGNVMERILNNRIIREIVVNFVSLGVGSFALFMFSFWEMWILQRG